MCHQVAPVHLEVNSRSEFREGIPQGRLPWLPLPYTLTGVCLLRQFRGLLLLLTETGRRACLFHAAHSGDKAKTQAFPLSPAFPLLCTAEGLDAQGAGAGGPTLGFA